MADVEELSFVIPGYTPETIPLVRLIEYLQQMSVILGDPENLHLIAINEGSVSPVLHAPKAVVLQAKDRVRSVQQGEGTRRQQDALTRVRRMIRRDAPKSDRPALLRSRQQILLEIQAAPEDVGAITGLRQSTTIDGQLIRVGGAGDDASLQIQDLQGKIHSGFTAKRGIAKDLAKLMWETVRLHGMGIWERTSDGEWHLDRMQVQSYETFDDEELGIVVERLRDLKVEWPNDALSLLREAREGAA